MEAWQISQVYEVLDIWVWGSKVQGSAFRVIRNIRISELLQPPEGNEPLNPEPRTQNPDLWAGRTTNFLDFRFHFVPINIRCL